MKVYDAFLNPLATQDLGVAWPRMEQVQGHELWAGLPWPQTDRAATRVPDANLDAIAKRLLPLPADRLILVDAEECLATPLGWETLRSIGDRLQWRLPERSIGVYLAGHGDCGAMPGDLAWRMERAHEASQCMAHTLRGAFRWVAVEVYERPHTHDGQGRDPLHEARCVWSLELARMFGVPRVVLGRCDSLEGSRILSEARIRMQCRLAAEHGDALAWWGDGARRFAPDQRAWLRWLPQPLCDSPYVTHPLAEG